MKPAAGPVSLPTTLAYGFGSVAIAAKDNGFNYFLLMFYSQVLGLSPPVASLALFLALCVDAVADPVVGYCSDGLHTRWGRRHPLMYAAVLPVTLGYYFLWNPPQGMSQSQMFCYLASLCVFVRVSFTLFRIPSDAMLAELTRDYDERTRLMGYRYFFAWLCALLLGLLVYKVYLRNTAQYPDGILNPAGWGHYGTAGALLIGAGILVTSLGTHARIPSFPPPPPRRAFDAAATRRHLIATLGNRSFLALFVSAMLFAAATGVSMTLNIYFSRYYWALSQDQLWVFSPVNLLAATAAMFLSPRVAARFDKKNIAVRLWVFAAVFLPVPVILKLLGWFPPGGSNALLDLLLIHSFIEICTITMANILIASMMADLVEDVEKDTGRRNEGLLFSALSFSAKAVTGLGVVFAGLILAVVHFPVGAAFGEVPQDKMTAFGVIAVGAMVLFYLLATWAMSFYRITRAGHLATIESIRARTAGPAP